MALSNPLSVFSNNNCSKVNSRYAVISNAISVFYMK